MLLLFLLLVGACAQNHSVLVLLDYDWPESFPALIDAPNHKPIDELFHMQWLHPAAGRLIMPAYSMDKLFRTDLQPINGSFRSKHPPVMPHQLIRKVIGLSDPVPTRVPHIVLNAHTSKTSPTHLKSQPLDRSPLTKHMLIVGWDDDYDDFTWSRSDLERYAKGWEFKSTLQITGNAEVAQGDPGLLCSSMVQLLSIWRPHSTVEVRRYRKHQHMLDFLYDLWFEDSVPEFVVFGQGSEYCEECENIIAQLRWRGVNFVASSEMHVVDKKALGYPASSPNVISVSTLDINVPVTSHGFCVSGPSDLAMHGLARVVHNKNPVRVGGTAISAILLAAALADINCMFNQSIQWKETVESVYRSRICPECFVDIIHGTCLAQHADYGFDNLTGMGRLNTENLYWILQANAPPTNPIPVYKSMQIIEDTSDSVVCSILIGLIALLIADWAVFNRLFHRR